jgi:hypothetical protein
MFGRDDGVRVDFVERGGALHQSNDAEPLPFLLPFGLTRLVLLLIKVAVNVGVEENVGRTLELYA